jgi:hypothetical protein
VDGAAKSESPVENGGLSNHMIMDGLKNHPKLVMI